MISAKQITVGVVGVLFLAGAGNGLTGRSAIPDDRKIIFSQKLDGDGTLLVLTKGVEHDKSAFAFWNAINASDEGRGKKIIRPDRYYDVRAEIIMPDMEPLTVGAFLRSEYSDVKGDDGVAVLKTLVERGRIAILLAEGSEIWIWQIDIPGHTTMSTGFLHWSQSAGKPKVLPDTINVELTRNAEELLVITITEKLTGRKTRYVQSSFWNIEFKATRLPGE